MRILNIYTFIGLLAVERTTSLQHQDGWWSTLPSAQNGVKDTLCISYRITDKTIFIAKSVLVNIDASYMTRIDVRVDREVAAFLSRSIVLGSSKLTL